VLSYTIPDNVGESYLKTGEPDRTTSMSRWVSAEGIDTLAGHGWWRPSSSIGQSGIHVSRTIGAATNPGMT
jgi:hypothetical protein